MRGCPRRRGRIDEEHDRRREREHDHARREAVEEQAPLRPERERDERRHHEVEVQHLGRGGVVPLHRAVPEALLQPGCRHAAEEVALEPELWPVEGVRRGQMGEPPALGVEHDQQRERDEVDEVVPPPPQHQCGGEEDEQHPVGCPVEAVGPRHRGGGGREHDRRGHGPCGRQPQPARQGRREPAAQLHLGERVLVVDRREPPHSQGR